MVDRVRLRSSKRGSRSKQRHSCSISSSPHRSRSRRSASRSSTSDMRSRALDCILRADKAHARWCELDVRAMNAVEEANTKLQQRGRIPVRWDRVLSSPGQTDSEAPARHRDAGALQRTSAGAAALRAARQSRASPRRVPQQLPREVPPGGSMKAASARREARAADHPAAAAAPPARCAAPRSFLKVGRGKAPPPARVPPPRAARPPLGPVLPPGPAGTLGSGKLSKQFLDKFEAREPGRPCNFTAGCIYKCHASHEQGRSGGTPRRDDYD